MPGWITKAAAMSRLSKVAPPHNHLYDRAPGMCMCVACCQQVLALRCPSTFKEGRCGAYRGHGGNHSLLVATTFLIADERVRLDGHPR